MSLHNAIGIDHVNPKSWEGKVHVGDVDLKKQWDKGRKAAEKYLQDFYGHPFNFETKFQNYNYDLLRPTGSYVGVSATADDAHAEEEREILLCPQSVSESPQTQSINIEHTESPVISDESSVSIFYLILCLCYLCLD